MATRGILILIGLLTLAANLLIGHVLWWLAIAAGIGVVVIGEGLGRLLPVAAVTTVPTVAALPTRQPPAHPLTARELEIAILVTQGLRNKEIGRRLFIEEKTVDNHVQHCFNKLTLNNRVELARWVHEQGLEQR